jgi:GR25 family glycosyltransferase involved in LPS biosynthesis
MTINIQKSTPLFYINLDDNIDRNNNIVSIINKYEFSNTKRVSAFNTRTIEKVNDYLNIIDKYAYDTLIQRNKSGIRLNHYELTNGSIGCYLSHSKIYDEIVKNNLEYAIILEDDCVINSDPVYFWNKISKLEIPCDADMLLLNAILLEDNLIGDIPKVHFFLCLHAYIITYAGAKKLLDNIFPIQMQIDSKISRLSYDNKFNIYALTNNDLKIQQGKMGTNIQNLNCPDCNIATEIYSFIENNNSNDVNYKYLVLILLIFILFVYIFIYRNI